MNTGKFRKLSASCAVLAAVAAMATWGCGSDQTTPNDVGSGDTPDVTDDTPDTPDTNVERDGVMDSDTASDHGGDTDIPIPDETARLLVEQGKTRLSAGESLSAMDSFSRALEIEPEYQDAEWGMVLARFQSSVSMWTGLIFLPTLKDDPDAVEPAAVQARSLRFLEWQNHDGTVGITIDGMYRAAMEQKARLEKLKAADKNPMFTLGGGLPLFMGDDVMMNLCCDWDISDVYAISSFNNLLLAFVSFLGSQNTDVSLDRLEDLFKGMPGIPQAITQTLEEYPDFLTLLPDYGADSWKAVKGFVAASADDALRSAELMAEDNGSTRNVATLSSNENPYLVLHGTFPSGVDEVEVLWDGKAASLKATVEKVKAHLSGTPDTRLSLDGDVLVAFGVLFDVVNRTVGLQTILDGLGLNLPDIVGGLLSTLDPNDPEQLVGLLGTVLPLVGLSTGSVELDLAAFFGSPFNVRDFMPNYGREPDSEYFRFLKSFECARGGVTLLAHDASDTCTVYIHDPSATSATIELTMNSWSDTAGTGEAFDSQAFTLSAVEGFTGLYKGSVELLGGEEPGTPGDNLIIVPVAGSVYAEYVSAAHADATVRVGGAYPDDLTVWDYGAACAEGAKAWDSPHFAEIEFEAAVEISTPGQSVPVSEIAADGKSSLSGAMAFKSPSFDGLIWLKNGETWAVANQASFATVINGVMAALEAF